MQVSHCAPLITLKRVRFQFTPESSVCNVLVAQVCWEAVSDAWPGGSKTSVA